MLSLFKGTVVTRFLSVGFFHQNAPLGPLRGTLGQFHFLPKIHRDIEQKVALQCMILIDTLWNGNSAVYVTLQNGDLAVYLTPPN